MREMPHTTVPCKDCPFREPGCHGRCDQYKAFRRVVDQIREGTYRQTVGDRDAYDYKKSVMTRISRRKHRIPKG